MLNGQEDLLNLNEKFGNLFSNSENRSSSDLLLKHHGSTLTGLCYWCESRGLMQCRSCLRSFCKFCIKNGYSSDKSQLVCFICGCCEISEVDNEMNKSCLRDREMQDMLHRYEELCSNDKISDDIHDLLNNLDSLKSDQLKSLFGIMHRNVFSMLHDIEKVERMVDHATSENRIDDIEKMLLPLMKVVTKHHIFKRLAQPNFSQEFGGDLKLNENISGKCEEPIDHRRDNGCFVDLTDEDRMEMSRSDSDDEKTQRSPLRVAAEEMMTMKFEITDESDMVPESCWVLSLVSSPLGVDETAHVDPRPVEHHPDQSVEEDVIKTPSKKRRGRQVSEGGEKRNVRTRSERALDESQSIVTMNSLQSELTEALAIFKSGEPIDDMKDVLKSPKLRKSTRKQAGRWASPGVVVTRDMTDTASSTKSRSSVTDTKACLPPPPVLETCKEEPRVHDNMNNRSSSSGSAHHVAFSPDLNKFKKVINPKRNSHLVCPAPNVYEKPFVLKEPCARLDSLFEDEGGAKGGAATRKTWSWERMPRTTATATGHPSTTKMPLSLVHTTSFTNGVAGGSIPVTKKQIHIIHRSLPANPSKSVTVKRSLSPQVSPIDELEPRKKRGRPRKYFNNLGDDADVSGDASGASVDERLKRHPSDLSDLSR